LPDRAAVEARLRHLGARHEWTRRQRDAFFPVPTGWLKLRETDGARAQLISYVRSTDDAGPRRSEYDVVRFDDAIAMNGVLTRALGAEIVVTKERALWWLDHTRVHLDRVDGLGEFLELETVVEGITPEEADVEARRIAEALALDPADYLPVPYRDLLHSEETGSRAVE
jgi:adenylate cyclase